MSDREDSERKERRRRWQQRRRPLVLPSLLGCDFARMDAVFGTLEGLDVAGVHLDVMDGHFVPNLSYGAPVVRSWRRATGLFFDAHLMMSDPGRYLDDFVAAGCDRITVHIEAVAEPGPLLERIASAGCLAGLSLNPPTPVEAVLAYLGLVDVILVMSVMPGFGGQEFQPQALEKVQKLREARPGLELQIDGGLNERTIGPAVAAGISQVVAGSAIFATEGSEPLALAALRDLAERAAAVEPRNPGAAWSSVG